jgi:hypothetical protein
MEQAGNEMILLGLVEHLESVASGLSDTRRLVSQQLAEIAGDRRVIEETE